MNYQSSITTKKQFLDLKLLSKILTVYSLIVLLSSCGGSSKIGYVDINKLYESFEYKKELAKEFDKIKMARQRICDSLEYELNAIATELEKKNLLNADTENEFSVKRKNFYQISKQFEEDNGVLATSYDAKIIKQLNAYIKEYGKKSNYQLLLGADMKGSVLYGDAKIDETDKLIIYVNERYKGEQVK